MAIIDENTESTVRVSITREVTLSELIEKGPQGFVDELRAALDRELGPIMAMNWGQVRVQQTPPAPPENTAREVYAGPNPAYNPPTRPTQ